jgi:DNA-binding XRE family transcriptional regulator
MKKKNNNLTSFESHLDQQYGKKGSKKREIYEASFEAFKVGVMLQELRQAKGLTQEQLAIKCGTTKNYISRIENDASDIRLSTLLRIIQQGFAASVRLEVRYNVPKLREVNDDPEVSGVNNENVSNFRSFSS